MELVEDRIAERFAEVFEMEPAQVSRQDAKTAEMAIKVFD
jgi:hypothetical protein